jgi:two-component sensor histidine kinase
MGARTGILLVGNPDSLVSALDILRTAGHTARAAGAHQALTELRTQPAELLLLDARLGEPGWRLCGQLQDEPEFADLPVLLLGSESTLLDRVAAQSELVRLRETISEHRVLLQETHHRVKNNLQWVNSVLFLQAAQLKQRELAAILEAAQGRVRSMALIHDALYRSESLASLSFREYLEQLCDNLWEAFEPRSLDMELELDCPDLHLGVDRTATCGLLVNELVTNAFKHGYPDNGHGKITVTFTPGEGTFALSVFDDGVSPPTGPMPDGEGTMGLQLIRLLTAKLRGKFSMIEGKGWGVRVEFPEREPGAVRG